MVKIILVYLIIINFVGFFIMFSDKKRAEKRKWRIPEKNIFLVAALGGSLGAMIGMYKFRHKTKHWYFKFLFSLFLIIHILIFYYFFINGMY